MTKRITKSTLILSGITLGTCTVCIPEVKAKPTQEVVAKYIKNGKYSATASEERKKELMQNIQAIRAKIRKAHSKQWVQVDDNTKMYTDNPVYLLQAKRYHAQNRLINTIFNQ